MTTIVGHVLTTSQGHTVTTSQGHTVTFTTDNTGVPIVSIQIDVPGVGWVEVGGSSPSMQVRRGRPSEQSHYRAGTVDVSFADPSGRFDPFRDDSDLADALVADRRVRVRVRPPLTDGWETLAVGYSEDWFTDYPGGRDVVASCRASDVLRILADVESEVAVGSAPQERTGARVSRLLDAAGVPGDVDDGRSVVAASSDIDGRIVSHLRLVEDTEAGVLFASRQGDVRFMERSYGPSDPVATFGAAGIEFEERPTVARRLELTVTRAAATWPGGDAETFEDAAASAALAAPKDTTINTLHVAAPLAQGRAQHEVLAYSTPDASPVRLTVRPPQTTAAWESLLGLELRDRVSVTWRPPWADTDQTVEAIVDGLDWSASGVDFGCSVTLSPTQPVEVVSAPFIADESLADGSDVLVPF